MRFLICFFLSASILSAQTSNPPKAHSSHSKKGSSGNSSKGTTPSSCGTRCGVERWTLKTLTDSEASIFQNATATDSAVPKLVSESAPAKLTNVRAPLEKQLFHLKALLIGWKEELGSTGGASIPDHDFHIVIADPTDTKTQMIIEVPDPACQGVCSSRFLDKIKAARSAVSSQLGQPSTSANVKELTKPWLVEVTGPALFDFDHGQDGLAKNCIEIHPVLEIKFLQEQSGGSVHVHTKNDGLPHNCGQR
jgi:hypothetical protein